MADRNRQVSTIKEDQDRLPPKVYIRGKKVSQNHSLVLIMKKSNQKDRTR